MFNWITVGGSNLLVLAPLKFGTVCNAGVVACDDRMFHENVSELQSIGFIHTRFVPLKFQCRENADDV